MESLPDRIVFIGGGLISFEFANVVAKAGAKVMILQRGKTALKNFDPFLVEMLVESLRASGIEIITEAPVISIEKEMNGLLIQA